MPLIVAFDLDGTLVDSVFDLASSLNAALAELSIAPVGVDDVRRFVGNGARILVERALASRNAIELVDEVLPLFRKHYERELVGQTVPYAGVIEMLSALKGVSLAVATNKPGVFARPLVEALLPGQFACVVGPDDAGALKPDVAMIRKIEAELGGRVIAFVGDSGVDMETARNAGIPGVAVAWGLKPDEAMALATHRAATPAALAVILSEIVASSRRAA